MSVLEELTKRVASLHRLLQEPEPGFFTWKEMVQRQTCDLAAWWTEDDPKPEAINAELAEALVAAKAALEAVSRHEELRTLTAARAVDAALFTVRAALEKAGTP